MKPLNELNTEIKRFAKLRAESTDLLLGTDRTEVVHEFKDIHEYLLLIEKNLEHPDVDSLIQTVRDKLETVDRLLHNLLRSDEVEVVPVYFESN